MYIKKMQPHVTMNFEWKKYKITYIMVVLPHVVKISLISLIENWSHFGPIGLKYKRID